MDTPLSVATAPKTDTFKMRINPDVKKRVEEIYAASGMTLTDAVNVFIQQSINAEGLPFLVTKNTKDALHEQAVELLMAELQRGEQSVKRESDWFSHDELVAEFAQRN